jgi:hypothetical protein
MKTRCASPPVVPVEAAPTLRVPRYSVMLFWTQLSFCKILAYNLMRYCICLSYCCYTFDLYILVSCIEASVPSSRIRGVTSGIRAISTAGRKPS